MISARSVKDRLKQQVAARGKNMQEDFGKAKSIIVIIPGN